MCQLTRIGPSFLLHPLDLISGNEVPELAFFPGMDLSKQKKMDLFHKVIKIFSKHYTLVKMSTHAKSLLKQESLKVIKL